MLCCAMLCCAVICRANRISGPRAVLLLDTQVGSENVPRVRLGGQALHQGLQGPPSVDGYRADALDLVGHHHHTDVRHVDVVFFVRNRPTMVEGAVALGGAPAYIGVDVVSMWCRFGCRFGWLDVDG